MYGLINKSLRAMIIENHGIDCWDSVLEKSGVPIESFVSMQRYEDDVTYALVGAASEKLGASAEECLEAFGYYWATVVAPGSYGLLLNSTGRNLLEFLNHINHLHDRITTTFIGYMPPYFEVSHTENRVALRYESKRQGLTPFVIGILKGLAERFGSTLTFEPLEKIEVSEGETSVIHFVIN